MSTNKFPGTATQPQCNRKFCQFYKDQYCTRHFGPLCIIMCIVYYGATRPVVHAYHSAGFIHIAVKAPEYTVTPTDRIYHG